MVKFKNSRKLTAAVLTALSVLSLTPSAYAAIDPADWDAYVAGHDIVVPSYDADRILIDGGKADASTRDVVDFQTTGGTARKIVNITTDATDDSSAASVAYVKNGNGADRGITNIVVDAADGKSATNVDWVKQQVLNGNGADRTLTNIVTDGNDDKSATNVAWVKQQVLNGNGTDRTITNVVVDEADDKSATNVGWVKAQDTATLNNAKAYTDNRVNNAVSTANNYTDSKFNEAKDHTDSVGAMAAAMSSIPAPINGGKGTTSWGAGVGLYHGKTAAAIGVSHDLADNVRAQVKAATYGGQSMVGIGLGGSFGKSRRSASESELKGLLVNMSNRLDSVEAQNRALAKENRRLLENGSVYTSTSNYTNMYGNNFVVRMKNGEAVLYNLDGTPYSDQQMAKLAQDFYYNYGAEFDMSGFQMNPQGNIQYQDPETGDWLGGSEQSAVGAETVSRTSASVGGSDSKSLAEIESEMRSGGTGSSRSYD